METLSGRTAIYANYTEKEFLSGTLEEKQLKVIDVLSGSIAIHDKNKTESMYLTAYMYGDQDIKDKIKLTREDINNKSVENWAYAFVDWKKTFLLGKPVQYSPTTDIAQDEISLLNKYNIYEDKHYLDLDLYESVLCTGRGFRYQNSSKITPEDESPFELINLEPHLTECVYSSSIGHEQLGTYYETNMEHIVKQFNPETKEMENVIVPYKEYTFYTRNRVYYINDKSGSFQVRDSKPIILNEHLIIEYYSNRQRMGIIEIGRDIFNDINYVENLDMDDIEGFVNSIMVFTNAEVDQEGMDSIKQFGAVSIKSTDQKKASVEILQSRLKSLDTQIFYLRKLSALHSILSVPQAQNSGESSNAETGTASLVGQGFTSANIRVEGEEQSFRKCDRNSLKTIIKICKNNADSLIKDIKVSDIEIKFSRDMSENILVKTQALNNLMSANIPPIIRNSVIGLFSDPTSVTKLQLAYEEEKRNIEKQIETEKNKVKTNEEQDNEISSITNIQNQGQ